MSEDVLDLEKMIRAVNSLWRTRETAKETRECIDEMNRKGASNVSRFAHLVDLYPTSTSSGNDHRSGEQNNNGSLESISNAIIDVQSTSEPNGNTTEESFLRTFAIGFLVSIVGVIVTLVLDERAQFISVTLLTITWCFYPLGAVAFLDRKYRKVMTGTTKDFVALFISFLEFFLLLYLCFTQRNINFLVLLKSC